MHKRIWASLQIVAALLMFAAVPLTAASPPNGSVTLYPGIDFKQSNGVICTVSHMANLSYFRVSQVSIQMDSIIFESAITLGQLTNNISDWQDNHFAWNGTGTNTAASAMYHLTGLSHWGMFIWKVDGSEVSRFQTSGNGEIYLAFAVASATHSFEILQFGETNHQMLSSLSLLFIILALGFMLITANSALQVAKGKRVMDRREAVKLAITLVIGITLFGAAYAVFLGG